MNKTVNLYPAFTNLSLYLGLVCSAFLLFTSPCWGQDSTKAAPRIGGIEQVGNRIEFDDAEKSIRIKPWKDLTLREAKEQLAQLTGLSLGADYTSAFFFSNADMGARYTSGGMARFYGNWTLVNRTGANTGSFVFKIEHRHKYTSTALTDMIQSNGYVGFVMQPFSDKGFITTNLYWFQNLLKGRLLVIGGFLDPTDLVDMWGLSSSWMHFTANVFSNGADVIALPNESTLGLAVGGWLSDHIYGMAAIQNLNADPSAIFEGVNTLSNGEFLKHLELGMTSDNDYLFVDNVHLTFWHRDAFAASNHKEGWGILASANKKLRDQWMPFLRVAIGQDGGSILQTSISGGLSYQIVEDGDLFGIGYSWGQVNESTYRPGLRNQQMVEVFYRLVLTEFLAITPDLQWLYNPALNPTQNSLFVVGVRGRLAI